MCQKNHKIRPFKGIAALWRRLPRRQALSEQSSGRERGRIMVTRNPTYMRVVVPLAAISEVARASQSVHADEAHNFAIN